jgi:ankyrin repeat protein
VNSTSTKDGWSALIWACSMNNVQVAQILLDHKADVDQPGSKDGSTPLGWCAFKESVEVCSSGPANPAPCDSLHHCRRRAARSFALS